MKFTYKKAKIQLNNNMVFEGLTLDYLTNNIAQEIVFNTGMTGYEETLTDPSYCGQILTFTYPMIGNYGVGDGSNFESLKIHVAGVICDQVFIEPTHYLCKKTFFEWLYENNTPIIFNIDTRALTKVIREYGAIEGVMLINEQAEIPHIDNTINLVETVSIKEIIVKGSGKYTVIVVDCGCKQNIINCLLKFDLTLKIVPFDYDYSEDKFDGVFISNGPGDPKMCHKTIEVLTKVLKFNKPIYGICLGSQLMALAIGANTYKLKFGHRGQNQPCINLIDQKSYLTSQNHGYAIDEKTLGNDWIVSFKNLNDNTVAGIKHKTKPFASVQFHPEAAPGPQDTFNFFIEFFNCLEGQK